MMKLIFVALTDVKPMNWRERKVYIPPPINL
jgi:hypothetical protein